MPAAEQRVRCRPGGPDRCTAHADRSRRSARACENRPACGSRQKNGLGRTGCRRAGRAGSRAGRAGRRRPCRVWSRNARASRRARLDDRPADHPHEHLDHGQPLAPTLLVSPRWVSPLLARASPAPVCGEVARQLGVRSRSLGVDCGTRAARSESFEKIQESRGVAAGSRFAATVVLGVRNQPQFLGVLAVIEQGLARSPARCTCRARRESSARAAAPAGPRPLRRWGSGS